MKSTIRDKFTNPIYFCPKDCILNTTIEDKYGKILSKEKISSKKDSFDAVVFLMDLTGAIEYQRLEMYERCSTKNNLPVYLSRGEVSSQPPTGKLPFEKERIILHSPQNSWTSYSPMSKFWREESIFRGDWARKAIRRKHHQPTQGTTGPDSHSMIMFEGLDPNFAQNNWHVGLNSSILQGFWNWVLHSGRSLGQGLPVAYSVSPRHYFKGKGMQKRINGFIDEEGEIYEGEGIPFLF